MSYCAAEQGSLTRRHCVHQCEECAERERAEEAAEVCPDCLAETCKPGCPSRLPA